MNVAPRLALDIDGVVLVGEPADERHCLDIGARHEGRPRRAAERQYIEPAQMIGGEQHIALQPFARRADAQARDPAGGVEERHHHRRGAPGGAVAEVRNDQEEQRQHHRGEAQDRTPGDRSAISRACDRGRHHKVPCGGRRAGIRAARRSPFAALRRSEEHTSELKSLMLTSYAVFFLKTNNIDTSDFISTIKPYQTEIPKQLFSVYYIY